ncbi:MAG: hypothetical protein ACRYF0_01680 [Janthinobacterium lividum]
MMVAPVAAPIGRRIETRDQVVVPAQGKSISSQKAMAAPASE